MDLFRLTTIADLRELLDLLEQYEIRDFEVESEGRTLRLSKGKVVETSPGFAVVSGAAPMAAVPAPAAAGVGGADGAAGGERTAAALPAGVKVVASPMVGTFYRAASPEADPFVEVGDRIEDDATLCIIEAMKVMNEIPSGLSGVVKEILVKNGESVEFGQPLFHILTE